MWDVDFHKKSDFLGEVRLTKQDLAEKVPVDGAHEFTAALQPKPNVTDKFNRLVQGSLRFTCQVRDDFNVAECDDFLDLLSFWPFGLLLWICSGMLVSGS